MWKKYKYLIQNLDCPNCARNLEEQLNKLDHYQNVNINFAKMTISFETNLKENVFESILKDAKEIEGEVTFLEKEENKDATNQLLFLGIGLFLYLISLFVPNDILSSIFCFSSYVVLGYKTFMQALRLLKKGILNENFLIVISAIGAFIIEKQSEGFMVLFLYQIGKYFESRATGKVRKNVAELMTLKPTIAHKKVGEETIDLSPEEIKVGDILVVLQGEKTPVDGILLSVSCELDTSSLTGESRLTEKKKKEEIFSGSVNAGQVFLLKVTHAYQDSTVKRILDLMEHASDKKAKTENFVNRAARFYTPIMIGIAFLIFLLAPLFFSITYQESLYRAFMILVVSCPCAIAISVPLCYFAGLGVMSKHGILVKGSNYIDAISKINTFVFDKTGTLTKGVFKIQEIVLLNKEYKEKEIIKYLVYGESFSNHPLAKSIVKNYPDIKVPNLNNVKEIKGKGISYTYKDKEIKLGNEKFLKIKKQTSKTVIYIGINDEVIAYVTFGDELKENSKMVISKLKKLGCKTIMFTGDHFDIAKETSEELGLDHFVSDLLPDEKYQNFENLKREYANDTISFVGDGINDAPVLRLSDCGIAMGSGAESAMEASDVIIISNDLGKLLEAKELAKRTLFILKQNLIFALGLKLIVMIFSFFGIGTMGLAVFADVGVTILAILNSLRVLK